VAKVSIILPSVFPDDVAATIKSFHETTKTVDYEIVVVSPFEVKQPRVVWIAEKDPRGNVAANAEAFRHVTGDFVLACADDTIMRPGWDDFAMKNFHERERDHKYFSLGLHQSTRVINTVFGIYFPIFPFVRRATLDALGFFSDEYVAHFGDGDLALRIWDAGGRCEFSREPLVKHMNLLYRNDNATKKWTSLERDREVFARKWAPKYGRGWDTSHLRGFNIDIDAAMQLVLVRDQSIWFNDPLFKELCDNFQTNIQKCRLTLNFPA
jgi:GT2 family glycosyltransferase